MIFSSYIKRVLATGQQKNVKKNKKNIVMMIMAAEVIAVRRHMGTYR